MKITKKQIETEYLKKGKSIRQTAMVLGQKYDFIRDRMVKFGIPRRNASDSNSKHVKVLTKSFLKKEYIINKKSAFQIGKETKTCHSVIIRYLQKFNIKIRNHKESHSIRHPHNYTGGRPKCIDCGKLIWYRFKRCKHCARKKQWKNPEYRNKTLKAQRKAMKLAPNKAEKKLNRILNKDYKFVGNGKIFFDGYNPDFINVNGQKKIIELFGNYWHNKPEVKLRDKKRIRTYAKYGYSTLVIWEHELNNAKKLKEKINEFVK
jgi:very-short-patch-repair endonuclease